MGYAVKSFEDFETGQGTPVFHYSNTKAESRPYRKNVAAIFPDSFLVSFLDKQKSDHPFIESLNPQTAYIF